MPARPGRAVPLGRSGRRLAGCLTGLTYTIHGYWREDDPQARREHETAFKTNVGLLGALALVAARD